MRLDSAAGPRSAVTGLLCQSTLGRQQLQSPNHGCAVILAAGTLPRLDLALGAMANAAQHALVLVVVRSAGPERPVVIDVLAEVTAVLALATVTFTDTLPVAHAG